MSACPTCKVEGKVWGPLSLWRCEDHGFYMTEGFENAPLVEALNREYARLDRG